MATKLNAEMAKRAEALSITAKSEEELREKLIEILEENDLPGMEEEETEMLFDLAESLSDSQSSEDDEPVKPTKKAAKAPEKKSAKKVVEEDDEDEDEEDEEDDEPVKKPSKKPAKKVVEEDDDEEDDEPVKPTKKAAKAPEKKSTKKVVEEDEDEEPAKPVKKAAKAPAKKAEKATAKRGTKMNPKENEEDRDTFMELLGELFPEKNYIYAWVATSGVTIKYKGKNSNRAIILVENATRHENDKITFNLFFLTFGKKKEILEEAGIDYQTSWNNVPFIKAIDSEEAMELLNTFETELKESVKSIDKKMGDNRAKMEEKLKSEKQVSKKPAKKVVEEDDDDDDDDDDEPVKPTKKVTKAPEKKPAKKVVEEDDEDEDEEEPVKKPSKKASKK